MALQSVEIEKFASNVVRDNPNTLFLAQKITKSPFSYGKNDVQNIIINYLRQSKYDSNCIDALVELHPDKKMFDTYFRRKLKQENYNCIGCGTFGSEGEQAIGQNSEQDKYSLHQKMFWAVAGLGLLWILKSVNDN
jgi:hypothetical protein